MGRFEVVLFDAGGTLLGTNTENEHWYEMFFVDACAEMGYTPPPMDEVKLVLAEAAHGCPFPRRCSSPLDVRQYWQHVYSEAFRVLTPGHDPQATASHYIDRFEVGEYIQLFPDTLPTLEALRRRRLRAGVVSNFGTYLAHFLRKLGIAHHFDVVLISAAEGCEKPQPEIFERAAIRAGADPARIMFVGDHPVEDYEASERHGFFPVLIDRHDKHADKLHVRRVRALTDIIRLFDEPN